MSILKSTRLCYTLNGILLHTGLPQVVLSGCSDNVIIFKEFAPSTLPLLPPPPVFLLLFKAPVRSHENQCKISNLRKYCQRPVRHLAESLTFTCILIKFCCFLCFEIFDTRSAEKEPNIRIVWGWSSSCYYEGGKWYLENHESRKPFYPIGNLEILVMSHKILNRDTKENVFFFSHAESQSWAFKQESLHLGKSRISLCCSRPPRKKIGETTLSPIYSFREGGCNTSQSRISPLL